MNEMLLTMLQSLLVLAVVLLTIYAVKWIATKTNQTKSLTDNETARRYVGEASKAISDAVLATSQTYVDALKENEQFSTDNQKVALAKAVNSAKAQMTKGAEDFIKTAYGDVNKYLEEKIEAEIKSYARYSADLN